MKRFFVFSSIGLLAAACGGAAESSAPAKAPAGAAAPSTPVEEKEPATVAEAQEQIDRARDELTRERSKVEANADSATTQSTPMKPGTAREEKASVAPADACTQPCRALSSMRRAVSALCRMTGEADTRCEGAKKTLGESESRVAPCHCTP